LEVQVPVGALVAAAMPHHTTTNKPRFTRSLYPSYVGKVRASQMPKNLDFTEASTVAEGPLGSVPQRMAIQGRKRSREEPGKASEYNRSPQD